MTPEQKLLAQKAIDENVEDTTARRIIRYVMECELWGQDTISPTNEHLAKKYNWSLETVKVAISKAKKSQFITTTGYGKKRCFELNVGFLKGKMAEIYQKSLKPKIDFSDVLPSAPNTLPNSLPNTLPNTLPNSLPNSLEQKNGSTEPQNLKKGGYNNNNSNNNNNSCETKKVSQEETLLSPLDETIYYIDAPRRPYAAIPLPDDDLIIEPDESVTPTRLLKRRNAPPKSTAPQVFSLFAEVLGVKTGSWLFNKTERLHAEVLFEERGLESIRKALEFYKQNSHDPYCPQVAKPSALASKWSELSIYKRNKKYKEK